MKYVIVFTSIQTLKIKEPGVRVGGFFSKSWVPLRTSIRLLVIGSDHVFPRFLAYFLVSLITPVKPD